MKSYFRISANKMFWFDLRPLEKSEGRSLFPTGQDGCWAGVGGWVGMAAREGGGGGGVGMRFKGRAGRGRG